jgi:Fe2+ or Zn2+ uptake regulation protein
MAHSVPRGSRRTPQRTLVLDAVRDSGCEHPKAEAVLQRVQRRLPRVSLGTVHRNLQRLVSEGLIGATRAGHQVTAHALVLYGRCAGCVGT